MLGQYEFIRRQIEAQKDSVLYSGDYSVKRIYSNVGHISDQTAEKVIERSQVEYRIDRDGIVKTIDTALNNLTDKHNLMFTLKFRKFLGWPEVNKRMGIDTRESKRLYGEIIREVGRVRSGQKK